VSIVERSIRSIVKTKAALIESLLHKINSDTKDAFVGNWCADRGFGEILVRKQKRL